MICMYSLFSSSIMIFSVSLMYPLDRRVVALRIYSILHSSRKTAHLLQVSHATVARWVKSPSQKSYPKRSAPKTEVLNTCLRTILVHNPLLSVKSIQSIVFESFSSSVSTQLIRCVIKSNGFTKKKARFHGQPRCVINDTYHFLRKRDKFLSQGRRFVSLDETSFGRNSSPVYGFSMKGHPLFVKKRIPRISTTSVLAAIEQSGTLSVVKRVGAFDSFAFLNALKMFSFLRGTVLMLDNVKFHHSKLVKKYAEEKGIELLYVPPYSPWFNPIEGVFSVVKRHYYAHGSIDNALQVVSTRHANAFFQKSLSLNSGPEMSGS